MKELEQAIETLKHRQKYTEKAKECLFEIFDELTEWIFDDISFAAEHNVRCKWSYYENNMNLIKGHSLREWSCCYVAIKDGRVALVIMYDDQPITEATIIEPDEVDYININDAYNGLKLLLKKIADLETNKLSSKMLDNILTVLSNS